MTTSYNSRRKALRHAKRKSNPIRLIQDVKEASRPTEEGGALQEDLRSKAIEEGKARGINYDAIAEID